VEDDVSVTAPSVIRIMKQRIRWARNAIGKLKQQKVLVGRNHGGKTPRLVWEDKSKAGP
jgi:hypothetical protein